MRAGTDSQNFHADVNTFSQKRERRVNDSPSLRCNCNFPQTYSHTPCCTTGCANPCAINLCLAGPETHLREKLLQKNTSRKAIVISFCIFRGSLPTFVLPRTKTCQVDFFVNKLCFTVSTVRGNTQQICIQYALYASIVRHVTGNDKDYLKG